ncbi:MAG: hypothetical protein J7K88_11885 [Candidatus Fermentibacteraceae bacterium]|nr:hypothetical protein [Candidatus Fermentibacteraceae bacterium]
MLTLMLLIAGLQVHEWGVVTTAPDVVSGAVPTDSEIITAEPLQDPLDDRAPVVYFHGDPCSVTVRISFSDMGYTTAVLPEPDEGGINSTYAVWNNLRLTEASDTIHTEGWVNSGEHNYPFPVWRQVDALNVSSNGETDRFIYYECRPGSMGDLPFVNQSGNFSFRMPYGEIPCIVLTSSGGRPMFGVFTLADILTSIPKGLQFLDEPVQLERELWRWADGVLNEDEFDAFWSTWESRFLADSSTDVMILYRLPEETVERIAALEVVPDIHTEVTVNRFIIAELPYRTE